MKLSVIIPAYNAQKELPALLDSLANQRCKDLEVIVVDDCSQDKTCQIAASYECISVRLDRNRGPATCRNIGAKRATGDVLAFTDSDCTVEGNWSKRIQEHFLKNDIDAVMGRIVLTASTYLGDSISALGFPAGGAIGFDKIWKVDPNGFTKTLSTCNCAIRKNAFEKSGRFDESFPFPGGEDSLLAYNLGRYNCRIRYCPDVVVYHGPRNSFSEFVRWQFRRGVSSFIFSTKVAEKGHFVSLRIWSTKNVLKTYWRDKKFPLIAVLLVTSLLVQLTGFFVGAQNRSRFLTNDSSKVQRKT